MYSILEGKIISARESEFLTKKVRHERECQNLTAFSLHLAIHWMNGKQVVNPHPIKDGNANTIFAEIYVIADYVRWGNISPTYMSLLTPIYKNRRGESNSIEISFAPVKSLFVLRAKDVYPKTSPNIESEVQMYAGKGEILYDVKQPLFINTWLPDERKVVHPGDNPLTANLYSCRLPE